MNILILVPLVVLAPIDAIATHENITSSSCNMTHPCPLKGGLSPLPKCPELRSKDGFLDVVLTVEVADFQFEWLHIPRRSYNGSKCPPTLRVKPGDILNLTLINQLVNGSHVPGANLELNITNIHTHGLHISSLEPQDNVFVKIGPGESYQYSYKILSYHSPGTYWYHSHHHKSTAIQTVGGMAGMLIVQDDPNAMPSELREVSCPENCEHDISLIVSPMLSLPGYLFLQDVFRDSVRLPNPLENWLRANVNEFTVNGEFLPVITLEKDQLTRFRILNVGQLGILELHLVDENGSAAPCDFREIARDGVYYDEPSLPKEGQSVVHPGNRIDWLIKCTEIGVFKLSSHPEPRHTQSFGGGVRRRNVIANIAVTERIGNSTILGFPSTLPERPPEYLADLRNATPNNYITVEIGGNNAVNREKWTVPTNYRFKVEVDSVVEIQLVSADYDFAHPMHFHINHFQVIGYQPYTGPVSHYQLLNPIWELRDLDGDLCYYQHNGFIEGAVLRQFNITDPTMYQGHYDRWAGETNDSLAYDIPGRWMDTVYVPALSNITLRMQTDRFTGPLVIHCHIPGDSDLGLMMVIEVVEKGANLSDANILSGGAAPGSCRKCDWNRFQDTPPECSAAAITLSRSISLIVALKALMMN